MHTTILHYHKTPLVFKVYGALQQVIHCLQGKGLGDLS